MPLRPKVKRQYERDTLRSFHQHLSRRIGQSDGSSGCEYRPNLKSLNHNDGWFAGSGKTTTTGKLAKQLKDDDKEVLLVAADIYRPAAIDQLSVGATIGSRRSKFPVRIQSIAHSRCIKPAINRTMS